MVVAFNRLANQRDNIEVPYFKPLSGRFYLPDWTAKKGPMKKKQLSWINSAQNY